MIRERHVFPVFLRGFLIVWLVSCACLSLAAGEVLFDLHAREGGLPLATPIEAGGARPAPFSEGGVAGLRQTCNFTSGITREGWDFPLNLDLRTGRGIQLRIRCAKVAPISYFAVYFKSGNGWYRNEFSVAGTGRWETVDILKADSGIEGRPAGWGRIERIRICAWASGAENTVFDVAAPRLLSAPLAVVVARGSSVLSGGAAGEIGLVARQARVAAAHLQANGIVATFMEDLDLSGGVPTGVKAIVLPYNPGLVGAVERAMVGFYANGGALVGFYTISDGLQQATGIRKRAYLRAADVAGGFEGVTLVGEGLAGAPKRMAQTSWNINVMSPPPAPGRVAAQWVGGTGEITPYPAILLAPRAAWMSHILRNEDAGDGGKLLFAMLGHAWPDAWRLAVARQLTSLAREVHPDGFAAAIAWLDDVAMRRGIAAARSQTAAARGHRNRALQSLAAGSHRQAMESLNAAENAVREAFFLVQPSADEFRGAWCHRGYGVTGWSWEESARQLRALGFTAIMPNVANASQAWYPTALLASPPAPHRGRNYLAESLAAARRHGLQIHPWLICFRLDDNTPAERVAELKRAGRLQQTAASEVNERWLCPNHPENRRQMLGVAAEILTKYPVDGLHLDFIRLPGAHYCHCPHCRQGFERQVGRRLPDWPQGVRAGGAWHRQWSEFRVASVSGFVRDVAALRDRVRPAAKLSVAVYADAASARRSVAQDWPDWAAKGYIDFVCPMNYSSDERHLAQMVARQQALAGGRVPVYPGLGLSANGLDGVQMVKQIGVCRAARTGGFMVFEFNRREALGPLADLAKGIVKPAPPQP